MYPIVDVVRFHFKYREGGHSLGKLFGKEGLIAGLVAVLVAVLAIWTFPQQACSLYYQDDVYLTSTPFSICKAHAQWKPFASTVQVKSSVESGQLRRLGEQCYQHTDCIPGGDGNQRCVSLNRAIEAAPKFCLSRDMNCPFPGRPGLMADPDDNRSSEAMFGEVTYKCHFETDGKGNNVGYSVVRK